ncbi:MAG TPA: flagellar basal body rod protein FlgB [Blastocatellia bacterium]|nr:flagellar basal body rod protein FlgB [Blastocatellia bacterium]
METGFDRITSLLTNYLDVQSKRTELVSSNIANADTPGFTAKELDFADYLKQAAREAVTPEAGFQPAMKDGPRVIESEGLSNGIDGNNVDVGREMTKLSEAGMQFLAGTNMLQSRLRLLRAAIREGR